MDEPRRILWQIVTDRRIWGVTSFLVGWPALGMLTRQSVVLETATPMVYVYLIALNAVAPGFPSNVLFWVGFVCFYFVGTAVLVSLFDWVQTRRVAANWANQQTAE